MSKTLPIDSQVAAAIECRQESFRQLYAEQINADSSTEDSWYWQHMFTVLDHAKKIFETPISELSSDNFMKSHK